MSKHTLSVLVEDRPSALTRITDAALDQVTRQLEKLINVLSVTEVGRARPESVYEPVAG